MRTTDDRSSFHKRRARRVLSLEELRLWQRATADVRPLSAEERNEPATMTSAVATEESRSDTAETAPKMPRDKADPPRKAVRTRPSEHRSLERRPPAADLAPGVAPGLDIRTLLRLKRGLIAPQSEIDLHQCTQVEAHVRLLSFLSANQARERRCVLVITGKGYGPDGKVGVLKTMVPRWLNEPTFRSLVIAFAHAIPQHGGEGALYVLLRRNRPAV
ncbi:MAG: Smr/MutS family protein [Defluviicoccus sp.]|nr:MAG: Smr/MutS family protein [Defluviicoccus sp.]